MNRVILVLDKMEKMDRAIVLNELVELTLSEVSLIAIEGFLDAEPSLEYFDQYAKFNFFVREELEELREIIEYLEALKIADSCLFHPFLARGLDVIYTEFELAGKTSSDENIDIYITPIGTVKHALVLARELRNEGKRVEVELSGKKVRKAMERANKGNVLKVIVLGEDEITNGQYMIGNMTSGEIEARIFSF